MFAKLLEGDQGKYHLHSEQKAEHLIHCRPPMTVCNLHLRLILAVQQ